MADCLRIARAAVADLKTAAASAEYAPGVNLLRLKWRRIGGAGARRQRADDVDQVMSRPRRLACPNRCARPRPQPKPPGAASATSPGDTPCPLMAPLK
jgi:hypothetical protein